MNYCKNVIITAFRDIKIIKKNKIGRASGIRIKILSKIILDLIRMSEICKSITDI